MLYTHYPGSWITTSAVILYYTPIIRVTGLWLLPSYDYRHYPGSWMTSAVILYYTPIIRVAELWLLQSYYTIHPVSGHLDYDFCSHIILYTDYPGSWIMTSAVIWLYRHYPGSWMTSAVTLYYTPIIRVAGLWLLQSYYTIHPLSG
jgi:hypothetical protein